MIRLWHKNKYILYLSFILIYNINVNPNIFSIVNYVYKINSLIIITFIQYKKIHILK